MKMMLRSILLLCLCCYASCSVAQESPVPMLQKTANNVIKELRQNRTNLKSNPQLSHHIVRQYLLPNTDVTGMSRSVLGREVWRSATSAQKKAFSEAFTTLVVRTYASALADYTDERVIFQPIRGDISTKRRLQVFSKIIRDNGPDISLSYRVVSKKGQWKVYDMSVEGVSLLQSFRAQFKQELSKGKLSHLISKLTKMNEQRA